MLIALAGLTLGMLAVGLLSLTVTVRPSPR